ITVGDLEVHLRNQDDARTDRLEDPVVFLHGYLFNTLSWREVQPELSELGRTINFDRPGFGLTERPEPDSWGSDLNPYSPEAQVELTVGLLDELEVDRAVLIAHNSGAATALELALNYPDRVAGMVLISPAVYRVGGPPNWLRPLLSSPQLTRVGPLLMRQLSGDSGGGFVAANWADSDRVDDAAVEAFARNFQVHDWDQALWQVSKASHEVDFLDRLNQIDTPTLVIAGAEDAVVEPEDSRNLAAALA